jgi:hypothetical protein
MVLQEIITTSKAVPPFQPYFMEDLIKNYQGPISKGKSDNIPRDVKTVPYKRGL